ncbi:Uncharacterised protein [uncultured archaeon]|nr:Uncharacterised protein [uncultured archaeon]
MQFPKNEAMEMILKNNDVFLIRMRLGSGMASCPRINEYDAVVRIIPSGDSFGFWGIVLWDAAGSIFWKEHIPYAFYDEEIQRKLSDEEAMRFLIAE